jgi:ABC-type polysaccharide/polyol phosphate export permease
VTSVATYRSSKELFANLTLRELRSKYKRSFLGWAWSLATPLANMAVYTVVFRYFLRITHGFHGQPSGLNVFALFLLCALLPWNFFSMSVMGCIGTVTANGPLIKKTYFPRELLPASAVAATLVSHLIELGLLIVTLVGFGDWRAVVYIPFLLLLTLLMALFAFGFGLMLSAINVYFRDVQHFMGILFLVWMYLTPIIYPLSVVPHRYETILKINPMTDASLCYRAVLYDGTYPGWLQLAYFAVWALGMLAVGLWVFARLEAGFAEEL